VARKKANQITLAEHVARIGRLGGLARAESLSPEERSESSRKAGRVGGRARARKLSSAKRRAIAQRAAKARWGKK
jgi:hypothetical protein